MAGFGKKMNGWKADEQTKKSRALDIVSAVQERSTLNGSARKYQGLCILTLVRRDNTQYSGSIQAVSRQC